MKIAYIEASWHKDILENGRKSYIEELEKNGIPRENMEVFHVPGSYEIPLQAKKLAITGEYDAIACSGLIVDGGIYRHDFVARAVIEGMTQVSLETMVPILSMVLTPLHFHEHDTHIDFFKEHFFQKGKELAEATIQITKNATK